jgi:serine/threonine protein kinase
MNVMHRDIKGANILLDDEGTLKLADFGLAKQYDKFREMYTNKVVTLWYRAPELLLGSYKYDKSIDIWSVGCFFSELFIGKPLFPGSIEAEQIDLIFRV